MPQQTSRRLSASNGLCRRGRANNRIKGCGIILPLMLFLCLSVLGACASLQPQYDPPKISLESFRTITGRGVAPRFEMKLRVLNPNKESLDIAGISYDIAVQGIDLISGVTNDVPVIDGYSEQIITLDAGLNTLQLIYFFASLGGGERSLENLKYRFSAKIDFNGISPTQRIEKSGVIGVSGVHPSSV